MTTPGDPLDALYEANARLSTLIENLNSAVIVEDETRHLAYINHDFLTLFDLTENPPPIGLDATESFRIGRRFFADPDTFTRATSDAREKHERVVGLEFTLVDDRIVELDAIPILVADAYRGMLWKF